ncbi:permease [Quadrisphaera sp. DSM 44207]|uniref:permease n=1 Tax=Quadrisphaera sp. DSM 44207 TaxID=1881057 RepID=UPI0008888190|nr:permease [Quadrisphaera sp. DSM 44207]SDQ12179.1 hypothetical protein SAMN05428996_0646 [Quadrisphaera sp. DSM 44207]
MSTPLLPAPTGRAPARRTLLGAGVVALVAAAGLAWAKWLPYSARTADLLADPVWPGSSLLQAGADAGTGALARAWTFTATYTASVWKALLVALVVAACVQVLLPRRWLLRVLARRTALGSSAAGGLLALPGMMCTCCTAPLAVTMRRAGVPTSAAVAFWLGNPVLNPAVLVFLALLTPWPWVAVRAGLGLLLVVGVAAVVGRVADRRAAAPAAAEQEVAAAAREVAQAEPPLRELPGRLARAFARLAVVLVPEYLLLVFVVGLVGAPLGQLLGTGGALAVLLAAAAGAVVVLPTGGEIPVVLALAAAGAGAGVLGALLIALPALSLPSALMVGRALGWRVTGAVCASTVAVAVVAGGALAVLS